MHVTIKDNNYIYLSNITQVEEDAVAARFSAENKANNRYVDDGQRSWDGVCRRYDAKRQRLARPFLAALKSLCKQQKFPITISDERPQPRFVVASVDEVDQNIFPNIVLEDFQVEAIKIGIRQEIGMFSLPTGAGKTECIAGLCRFIKCLTVIFADQRVIVDQIKARLELRDVADDIGLFYAGRTPNGQTIVVGSIQSLTTPSKIPKPPDPADFDNKKSFEKKERQYESMLKGHRSRIKRSKIFQQIVSKADMIICDECDLCSSSQYGRMFQYYCKARRRYGFSGTVFDKEKPVENLLLQERLGSIICKVDRDRVQAAGRIIPIEYIMLAIGEDGDRDEGSAFDIAYQEKLVESQVFHNLVAKICSAFPNDGTFILVERDDLGLALQDLIPGSVFIHGKTPKRRRDQMLREFESRELKVLIGGKIVKRGLDLSGGCENLVIATGGKSTSNINQQIGRAVRINGRGKSRVFDFLSLNNRYLYRHSRLRLHAVVDMGYKTRVVFSDGQQIDGAAFIASRFRRPKRRSK